MYNTKSIKKRLIGSIFVLAMVSVVGYAEIAPFIDTFNGPSMTNWSGGDDGQYNGAGQYVMVDGIHITRSAQSGSFLVNIELLDMQNIGTFNYRWDDQDGYRLHLMLAGGSGNTVAVFKGSDSTPWNWVELAPSHNFGTTVSSISLRIKWDEITSTITVSAAADGGAMIQIASYISQVPAPATSTPSEHLYYDGTGSVSLDYYSIALLPPTSQIDIPRVEGMPNFPQPYSMKDWKSLALAYDDFVFDFGTTGDYLPLIWWDTSRTNVSWNVFGTNTYVGDGRSGSGHEGIGCMGAVLGATVAGIDKCNQNGHNFVRDAEAYYNIASGQNMVLNLVWTGAGDWWYEVFPHILFYSLVYYYPGTSNMEAIMLDTADTWYDACVIMGGNTNPWTVPNFDHTYFDFTTMQPVDRTVGTFVWRQPGAAGGIGWLEYMAWKKSDDPKYLTAAQWGMEFLHNRDEVKNPYYEVMLPYGAYLAARMNAEHGKNYDLDKVINWCFNPSYNRPGFGVISDNWGGYDVHGLLGGINSYGFSMNTYAQAGAMVPIARYDQRYARALGKWMLNAANAARLFYPDELPDDHQSNSEWTGDPGAVIAYEGLKDEEGGKSPYATGDAMGWGMPTNFGLYGSGFVGMFGGIISPTNKEYILQLDCLATDVFHDEAYPTYLYFNPYSTVQTINIDVGTQSVDIYDTVTDTFLKKGVSGNTSFDIAADSAVVAVLAPANGDITYNFSDGLQQTLINGVVVNYLTDKKCNRYDLNGDCEFNLLDFAIAAQCWQVDCSANPDDLCCDWR